MLALFALYINFLRKVAAGVYASKGNFQAFSIFEPVHMVDHVVEFLPDFGRIWPAVDYALFYPPRFTVEAVAYNFILERLS